MIHIIIVNWFNHIGVWIWNWFGVKLNWKLWSGNFDINIIYGMIIKSPHDSWDHRVGFGRIGPGFEVSCRMLSVPLSRWFFWFVTIECIEMIHLSPKTFWEEFWTTDDACIRFVSNSSTELTNNFLYRVESCNNWLESCCTIVSGRWRGEMMIALTWSGQRCWSSNHI